MAKMVWFRHDTGTLNDLRMQRVMRLHGGMAGIGMYWTLVELLYVNDGKILFDEIPDLAYSMRVDEEKLMDIASDEQVFESDEDGFWSNRVNEELEIQQTASERARKSAENRWNSEKKKKKPSPKKAQKEAQQIGKNDATVMQSQCERNASAMQPHSDRNAQTDRQTEITDRQENSISSEPAENTADSEPAADVFIELPCIGTPSKPEQVHKVTEADVDMYTDLYPGLDIRQELRKMLGWLEANPRKKKRNTKSFIVNWLSRSQDRQSHADPPRTGVAQSVIRPSARQADNNQDGPSVRVGQL